MLLNKLLWMNTLEHRPFNVLFREAFRSLEQRLKIFVSLPIDKLDRIALTQRVEAIGRLRGDAVEDQAS